MSLRHDIHAHVQRNAPIARVDLVAYFTGRGERENSVQYAVSSLLAGCQLSMHGTQGNHRAVVIGDVAMPPPRFTSGDARRARTRRQARAVEPRAAGRPPIEELLPALQPIWPAVAGAPIGGLSPCIG